jgi:hypothetical protein
MLKRAGMPKNRSQICGVALGLSSTAAERFNMSTSVQRLMLYLCNQARITYAIASFNIRFLKIILISWKGRSICVVHAVAFVFSFMEFYLQKSQPLFIHFLSNQNLAFQLWRRAQGCGNLIF